MSKSSYGFQFFKYVLMFGVPIGVIALVSSSGSAKGKNPPKGGGPVPKASSVVPKVIRDWFDVPAESGGGAKPADTAVFAGWYTYSGRWIRVDEYPESAVVEIAALPVWMPPAPDAAGVTDKVVYKGRFRWTVMHDGSVGSPPLALGDTTETGTASRAITFTDAATLTAEARDVAIGEAAAEASQWIDAFNGKAIA